MILSRKILEQLNDEDLHEYMQITDDADFDELGFPARLDFKPHFSLMVDGMELIGEGIADINWYKFGRPVRTHSSWYSLSDRALRFLLNLMVTIYEDVQRFSRKAEISLKETEAWGFGRSDEISDILQEFVLIQIPFEVSMTAKRNEFCLRLSPKMTKEVNGFYIYRYYIGRNLMYLGRTNRPAKRYIEHCRDNACFENIDGVEIHKCLSKADMIFLERLLISETCPPWNTVDADNGELSYDAPAVEYEKYTPIELMQRFN